MGFSGGLFLTNAGRIALSKIQADSSKSLNFSKFAFGDGHLNGSLEIERTALINQKDTLRRMKRLGWFELYETKDVSRLVFSKKPFRQGLYTGAIGHGTADKPAEAAEFAEE